MSAYTASPARTDVRVASARTAEDSTVQRPRRRRTLDPLIVFQIYLALLVFSPSIYSVPGLGAAGTPATIFGCVILVLWVVGRLVNGRNRIGRTPLHWIVGIYCIAMMLSFCAGMLRPISAPEVSSSLRGLITLGSGVGVILFAADSMRTRRRLEAFLRSAVLAGFLLAALGVLQFLTGVNFVDVFHPPGLTPNSALVGVYQRSGYPRVSGTAIHSIEFSAVVGMVLPLAGHFAITAKTHRVWLWLQFAVMLVALPLTVSRSGAVALIVGLAFVMVVASNRQRVTFLLAAGLAAVAFRFVVPGMLGTIRSLFTGAAEDISINGRLDDYRAVVAFVSESPWFGRGFGTFLPELYRTLDNQFLGTVVEAGLIGAAALILLFLGPILMTIQAGQSLTNRKLRTQSFGIAAGITTAMLLAVTFDEFGFPMAFGMLCIVLGAAGAQWRVARATGELHAIASVSRSRRTALDTLIVLAVVLGILSAGGLAVAASHGAYEAKAAVLLRVPEPRTVNVYDEKIDSPGMSDVVHYIMDSPQVRDQLAARSVRDYTVAIGSGSLAPFTDVFGHGDLLWIDARGNTESAARRSADAVRAELTSQLAQLQSNPQIPATLKVQADRFTDIQVFQVPVNKPAAIGGLGLLAGLSTVLLVMMLGHSRSRRRSTAPDPSGSAQRAP